MNIDFYYNIDLIFALTFFFFGIIQYLVLSSNSAGDFSMVLYASYTVMPVGGEKWASELFCQTIWSDTQIHSGKKQVTVFMNELLNQPIH